MDDIQGHLHRRALAVLLEPILGYLEDSEVSEVMINGPEDVRVERRGRIERTETRFPSPRALEAAVRQMAQFVGKRLDKDRGRFDARLPDGSRVHVVLPPASRQGICVAIRKFSREILDLEQLIEMGAITAEAAGYLGALVRVGKNLIVSGGTGTGKTTMLNVISSLIPGHERIIVIEDSSELQLQQDHVLYFETRPPDRHGRGGLTIRDLFHSSLRMRPDRIIIGECRGGEALDLIQALTSGHGGSMSTLHANSPRDALSRLETMALMAGVDLPLRALRAQVASAIDAIIQLSRFPDGTRRVTEIAEVGELTEEGRYSVTTVFSLGLPGEGDTLNWTGVTSRFAEEIGRLDERAGLIAAGCRVFGRPGAGR